LLVVKMRKLFGRGRPLRLAIYTACLSAFVFFGYDQGVLSGLLENEYFNEQFGPAVGLEILVHRLQAASNISNRLHLSLALL
jgi:hypothetical protein